MPPISRKYSQPMPSSSSAPQSVSDSMVNMPPSTPTMTRTKKTIQPAIAALERILFFFAS